MADENPSTFRCSRCKQQLPASSYLFTRARGYRGLVRHRYCKPCEKAYKRERYLANKAKTAERARQWRIDNRAQYVASNAAYYKANKAAFDAAAIKWRKLNPGAAKAIWTASRQRNLEETRAREAAYRERNRAECNARIAKWKLENPDKARLHSHAKQRAVPPWADRHAMAAMYAEARRLTRSDIEPWHVDHIVPLNHPLVCGLHCQNNLRVVTAKVNCSKKNRHWPDMPDV